MLRGEIISDLTTVQQQSKQVKRRFNIEGKRCALCGKPIVVYSPIYIIKTPYGKYVHYAFVHSKCVVDYADAVNKVTSRIEEGSLDTWQGNVRRKSYQT